jgi:hypothetical protein
VTRHRITINDDLNPFAFLTTLLHEIAHAATWERLRQRRHQARAGIEAMLDSLAYLAGVSPPEAPMTENPRP